MPERAAARGARTARALGFDLRRRPETRQAGSKKGCVTMVTMHQIEELGRRIGTLIPMA